MSAMPTLSEAAILALHAVALLAIRQGRCVQSREMASTLGASQAHLSKVLQRLTKVGILRSIRGPKGGFVLANGARDTTLLDVYETIDGPLPRHSCLLGTPVCLGKGCVMGGLVAAINQQIREHLSGTRISQLSEIEWKPNSHTQMEERP
jgi:Rrf2 family protein